jgi:hypothetical protein
LVDSVWWKLLVNQNQSCNTLYKIWTKINKGKLAKEKVMVLSISIYLVNSLSHVPFPGNGVRNAYWHFLASLFTKLSSLAWCQKCMVGNY